MKETIAVLREHALTAINSPLVVLGGLVLVLGVVVNQMANAQGGDPPPAPSCLTLGPKVIDGTKIELKVNQGPNEGPAQFAARAKSTWFAICVAFGDEEAAAQQQLWQSTAAFFDIEFDPSLAFGDTVTMSRSVDLAESLEYPVHRGIETDLAFAERAAQEFDVISKAFETL